MDVLNNQKKSLDELLEAVSKGIDLLINDNLDKDLYTAYEKYVISTIKLIDMTNSTHYIQYFSQYDNTPYFNWGQFYYNPTSMFYPRPSFPSLTTVDYVGDLYGNVGKSNISEYKGKLKNLLQQLVSIAKVLICE